MGNVVGIDLGTTNSVAALKLVNVEIVKNNEENTQPDDTFDYGLIARDL